MKKCTKCGVEYPATTEYFGKHKQTKDKLNTKCKKCIKERRKLNYISKKTIKETECNWCFKKFKTDNITKKYCSDKCRYSYKENKKKTNIENYKQICEWCQKEFYEKRKKKYCSDTCKKEKTKEIRKQKNKNGLNEKYQVKCKNCGIEKMTPQKNAKFCSTECNYDYIRKKSIIKNSDIELKKCSKCERLYPATKEYFGSRIRGKNKIERLRSQCKECEKKIHLKRLDNVKYLCKYCGIEYNPKAINRKDYCTTQCAFEHKTFKSKRKLLLKTLVKPIANLIKTLDSLKDCDVCGKRFIGGSITCSDECYAEKARVKSKQIAMKQKALKTYVCRICNKVFTPTYGDKRKKICSEECKKKSDKETKKEQKRQRRARKRNAFVSKVITREIYLRDKGICQICGKKVNPVIKFPNLMCMSMDHIIPLSKGGTHEPKNVQLAHFICNSKKGDRFVEYGEQLRMC